MVNKRIKVKFYILFFCLFFLLLLTGCANMSTQMNINGEKFSGTRVMSVTFDMDELLTQFPGGTNDLNDLIDTAIPKQLSYKYEVNDDEATYNFTLAFDSKQDYIDKLKNLLNKAPEITFKYSTGVFTRGITYNENFESRELFAWFDKLITENNIIKNYSSENFWNQTKVTVILDGEEFTCNGGKVDIQSGGQSVVSNINISTALKSSGDIERTILITIPNSVEKSQITLIENYFNDNIPDNGAWSKRNSSNNIIYTITFTAGSAAKLQTYMEKFTGVQCECTLENVQDLSQPLAQSSVLSEYIDFSCFGGESSVNVIYGVSSEINSPYQINLNDGNQERNSEATEDGGKLVCNGDFTSIKFKTVLRKMATVDSIYYNLIQTGNNKFVREIEITLANGTDPSILDNISDYYNIKGAGNTNIVVENQEAPIVRIRVNGNAKQLMAAEAVLFGGVGARSLNYDRNWGIFTLHPKTTLVDSFDITSLISVMNVSGYVYTYSYNGNIITQVACSVDGEQDSKATQNERDSDTISFGLGNGIQTIMIQGYYFNGWAVFFIILFVLLLIALITMGVLLYLYKTGKIDLPINKKNYNASSTTEPISAHPPTQITVPEPTPMPVPEPEPIPLSTPEPRDLTETFDDENEPRIMIFETNVEPEPVPTPASSEPTMEPVLSYPEKYNSANEIASPDAPEPEPTPEPEPAFNPPTLIEPTPTQDTVSRESPDNYTDNDMIEDFDALGLLGEYKKHVQKVKVKVRKLQNDTTEE